MATNEISITDDELEALMQELETETADMVLQPAQPVEVTPVQPEPTPEPEPVPEPTPEPEPEPTPEPEIVVAAQPAIRGEVSDDDLDKMLDSLNAEVAASVTSVPEPAIVQSAHIVKPTPEPAAEPKLKAVPPAPIPAPEPVEIPEVAQVSDLENAGMKHGFDVMKFHEEMKILETNLDECMMNQASLRAYWGAKAAQKEAEAARLKKLFEIKESQLYDHYRKLFVSSGEKVTEKMIESAVKMDPQWIKGVNVVIEAQSIADTIKLSCVASLNDRRDMLIQLGANRREEGKGQLRVMAGQQAHADARQRAMDAARAG